MLRRSFVVVVTAFATHCAAGAVTEYQSFAQWQAATGTFTAIGFTEFPGGTFLTTQYESLGVVFPDGNDFIVGPGAFSLFPQDGAGLRGIGPIGVAFAAPTTSLAIHYPGAVQIELLSNGELIYTSTTQVAFPTPTTGFFGLHSTVPFNAARIFDWDDGFVNFDNLYFAPPVPSPAVFSIMAAGLLAQRRRRRF